MYETLYSASLETRILSATRMELVLMLYDAAVETVESARGHLAGGRIKQRSHAITKAVEVLTELSQSLDHAQGGELSSRLAGLYSYMQQRLFDANFRQTDEGLAETERLLKTLREAWAQVAVPHADTASAPAHAGVPPAVPSLPWAAPREIGDPRHAWSA